MELERKTRDRAGFGLIRLREMPITLRTPILHTQEETMEVASTNQGPIPPRRQSSEERIDLTRGCDFGIVHHECMAGCQIQAGASSDECSESELLYQ